MPAISVGSVEVDVLPNAQGIRQRMQRQLVPAADEVGEEIGRIIGRHVSTQLASAIRSGVTTGGRTALPAAARQGQATGSAFARAVRTRVEAALRDLPDIELNADSSDAEREIHQIRAQLMALRDLQIGVDIDAEEASIRISQLQGRLERLSASDVDIQVRMDTASAAAQLAAFQAQLNRLDGQTANVKVDTRSAAASMSLLTTVAIAFGPAILPVLPVVAAGLGAIAAAGTAAAVGVGAVGLVAIPAFKGIATTLQAQKAAQDAATNATYQGGQAASQGTSRALQLAGAQQSLATASRNGARQIAQAEQGISDAVRSASEGNRRAKEQLADAVEQAADRQQRAAEQVRSAEESLADAQRGARQAQQDLNQARRDAAQELAELADRLVNAELSERDAVLSVQEARDRLRAVQARGSKATLVEQQRAQLAYDQAVQRLAEQRAETKALTAEKKAADKAGVEGSDTVRDAQEQLRQADEAIVEQQKELAKARADAAEQQVESQEAVAEAQRNVARTQEDGARSVARAQEQLSAAQQGAADSIASAQRQIEQASLSAAGGVDQAAIAQAKYRAELAKLTPAARGTMNAYVGLRTAFSAWAKSLQPAVMPIFTRALNGLKNSLPGLTPFVTEAADAIKGLQDRASAGFKSPWWKTFKTELAGSVGPAITGLGISFGRIFKGMAGIVDAFLPHMDSISERMQKITGRFADWGTGLKGSPEFERFLAYSAEHAPMIAEALGQIFTALLDVGKALSPISDLLLEVLGGFAVGISWIATNLPGVIQLLYGYFIATRLIRLAVLGWAAAQAIANGALLAFNLISKAGPWGWIVLAILAVIGVVVYMYNRFDWFRNLVQTVWSAIQTAALWAWNNVLKPTFAAILLALQTVGKWAMWLYTNAIKPAFDAIVLAGKILLTAIVVAVILPIIVVFKLLGLVAGWLWENAIRPAFRAIAAIAVWLYRNIIKPQFDAVMAVFRAVAKVGLWLWKNVLSPVFRAIGDAAKWLYTNAIKPAFGWIADRASWVWNKGVKPAFDLLKAGVKAVGDAFKAAKDYIGEQWSKLRDLARKPVQYIVDVVYNNGIRGVWNKVADAFGAPKLPKYTFASGGIMPGYTPGRDVHKFVSPTGGALELSGGESIFRPEFTRAVGSGFVGVMNRIAKSRGSQGVKAVLAPVFGGNPSTPTDTSLRYANGGITQSFADGGIFGWIGKAASAAVGAGSAAWNGIKKGASWLADTLEASARAGVKNVVNPLLSSFPGMDTGFGRLMRGIPDGIVDALFGYSKEADKKGGGGIGGPKIQAALKWAKTQNGLPYQWGGNGNPSWDCSGFMSAIESVIRGQTPHRRWSTHAFSGKTAPPGWVKSGDSPFRIGITAAGVGHTAGTLGNTKVESRGGDGVIVGSRARGYNDKLFTDWYGFQPGKYDSGGYLQPGLNLAYNGTGRPEPVFTAAQSNALTSMAGRGGASGPASFRGDLYLDSGEFLGKVRGEATQVMHQGQQQLIQVLNAN